MGAAARIILATQAHDRRRARKPGRTHSFSEMFSPIIGQKCFPGDNGTEAHSRERKWITEIYCFVALDSCMQMFVCTLGNTLQRATNLVRSVGFGPRIQTRVCMLAQLGRASSSAAVGFLLGRLVGALAGVCELWTQLKTPVTCLGIFFLLVEINFLIWQILTDVNWSARLANSQICHWWGGRRGCGFMVKRTHWRCRWHASSRWSPARTARWPRRSETPRGRRNPSRHHLECHGGRGGGEAEGCGGAEDGACAPAELPPDLADTAQYSALISSDSRMASCSVWYSWSGDWAENKAALKHLTFIIYHSQKSKNQNSLHSKYCDMSIGCNNMRNFWRNFTHTEVLLGPDKEEQNAGRVVFLHGILQPLPTHTHTHTLLYHNNDHYLIKSVITWRVLARSRCSGQTPRWWLQKCKADDETRLRSSV